MSVFDQDDPGFQVTLDKGMIVSILAALTLVCLMIFILGIVVGRNTINPDDQLSVAVKPGTTPAKTGDTVPPDTGKIKPTSAPVTNRKPAPTSQPQPGQQPADMSQQTTSFAIQVAYVSKKSSAERVKKKLNRLGYSNVYISILEGKTKGYRVRLGPYKTRGDATNEWRKLKRHGYREAWIVEN